MSKEPIEENGVITNMTETEYLEHLKEIHKPQLVGEVISGLKDNTCRAEFSALGSENKKDFTEISILKENHCICKVKFYGIPYYDTNEIDFHWHTGNGDYTFTSDSSEFEEMKNTLTNALQRDDPECTRLFEQEEYLPIPSKDRSEIISGFSEIAIRNFLAEITYNSSWTKSQGFTEHKVRYNKFDITDAKTTENIGSVSFDDDSNIHIEYRGLHCSLHSFGWDEDYKKQRNKEYIDVVLDSLKDNDPDIYDYLESNGGFPATEEPQSREQVLACARADRSKEKSTERE